MADWESAKRMADEYLTANGICAQCGAGPVHPAFEPWRACSLPCVETELDARFLLKQPEAPRVEMFIGPPAGCRDCAVELGSGDPVWFRGKLGAHGTLSEVVCWECARPKLLGPRRQWEEERRQRAREVRLACARLAKHEGRMEHWAWLELAFAELGQTAPEQLTAKIGELVDAYRDCPGGRGADRERIRAELWAHVNGARAAKAHREVVPELAGAVRMEVGADLGPGVRELVLRLPVRLVMR